MGNPHSYLHAANMAGSARWERLDPT